MKARLPHISRPNSKQLVLVLSVIAIFIWGGIVASVAVVAHNGAVQAQHVADEQAQLHRQAIALAKITANQVTNRAKNVGEWCGAINEGRIAERAILNRFHLVFPLQNLDCKALIAATKQSAKAPAKKH